jgi:hypothetical protein
MVNKGRTCEVDGCTEKASCKGKCSKHYWRDYERERRSLPPSPSPLFVVNKGRTCEVDGCVNEALAKGKCPKHYARWRRKVRSSSSSAKSMFAVNKGRTCEVDGCVNEALAKRKCSMHYARWRKSGWRTVGAGRRLRGVAAGRTCTVDGCERPVRCREKCGPHSRLNPDKYRLTARERYRLRRALLDWLKAAPCMVCGNIYPPEAMDFDHRDPAEKVSGIGVMVECSMERLQAELMKCDLLCASCHRVRTRELRVGFYSKTSPDKTTQRTPGRGRAPRRKVALITSEQLNLVGVD